MEIHYRLGSLLNYKAELRSVWDYDFYGKNYIKLLLINDVNIMNEKEINDANIVERKRVNFIHGHCSLIQLLVYFIFMSVESLYFNFASIGLLYFNFNIL